jgi:acetyl esterase
LLQETTPEGADDSTDHGCSAGVTRPLDPQVEVLLEQMASTGSRPVNEVPVEEGRQLARLLALLDGDPEPVEFVDELVIPGAAGDIGARMYRPGGVGSRPVLAWFHAGGGVIGDLETADRSCRKLANRTGGAVLSVDYRRAPEHRFPAAVEDCWAATRWLAAHATELGGDPDRMAVGGDSMGGTFAAVVAQLAARSGDPILRHQLLVYPFTDLTLSHPSIDQFADGYLLTKALTQWFIDHYLGPRGDAKDPLASPLFAEHVDGVAPATIVIAECDPARDEGLLYGEKLRDADVPVEMLYYEGMIHVFFAFGGVLDRATEAMDAVAAALRAALV